MNSTVLAEKYLFPFLASCLALTVPVHPLCGVVFLLVFGDMFLGIWAAKKRQEPITSARLRDTVSKLFIYLVVVVITYFAEKYMMPDMIPAVKLVTSAIAFVELKSILENASEIRGKSLFVSLIKLLGSKNRD